MGHVMRDLSKKWPNSRIPFEIDPSLSLAERQIVQDAVFFWNSVAGVLLTPHTGEAHFSVFTRRPVGGNSSIGRVGGRQTIEMDLSWSEAVGALLHETGHTAGLIHEHQRPDRDQYVIAPANMDADSQITATEVPIGPYDCRSVMQYYISSTDPNSFRTKAPGCCEPFHGVVLSLGDIRALQSIYWGCAWAFRRSGVSDIGVGVDGTAWVTHQNSSIERWEGANWQTLPGGAERIGVSSASKAWVVNANQNIFEWDQGTSSWKQRPGAAKDVSATNDGGAWVIGTNAVPGGFGIYRWNGAAWEQLPGGAVRISARSHDDAWVVNDRGFIFQWNPVISDWNRRPGVGHDIAVGVDGTVGKTDLDGVISQWSPERSQWNDIDTPPRLPSPHPSLWLPGEKKFQISIGPSGLPWVVNPDGDTFDRLLLP
jgi:hypothetical protein